MGLTLSDAIGTPVNTSGSRWYMSHGYPVHYFPTYIAGTQSVAELAKQRYPYYCHLCNESYTWERTHSPIHPSKALNPAYRLAGHASGGTPIDVV